MKKKELMKRLSALAMSAMMTVTMIPSNAFAADIEFSDGGQEAIEVQADEEDNAEISIQDEDTDNAEDLMGENLTVEDSEDAPLIQMYLKQEERQTHFQQIVEISQHLRMNQLVQMKQKQLQPNGLMIPILLTRIIS